MRSIVPTTSTSPMTVITVVDVVGVSPKVQTSRGAPVGRQRVARRASSLCGSEVMRIKGMSESAGQVDQLDELERLAGVGDEEQ